MSLTLIEINGDLYHAQDLYDEDGENVVDTIEILDEDGEMIPASICLCYAFEPGECCCATTAWENYRYDDYDMEDGDDTA
jgi:hypothetical protein